MSDIITLYSVIAPATDGLRLSQEDCAAIVRHSGMVPDLSLVKPISTRDNAACVAQGSDKATVECHDCGTPILAEQHGHALVWHGDGCLPFPREGLAPAITVPDKCVTVADLDADKATVDALAEVFMDSHGGRVSQGTRAILAAVKRGEVPNLFYSEATAPTAAADYYADMVRAAQEERDRLKAELANYRAAAESLRPAEARAQDMFQGKDWARIGEKYLTIALDRIERLTKELATERERRDGAERRAYDLETAQVSINDCHKLLDTDVPACGTFIGRG